MGKAEDLGGERGEAPKHKSAPEMVVGRIIGDIEAGRLEAGEKLPPHSALAKMFGVGMSSIREAVNALEVMGYLEVTQGRGTFVKEALPMNKSLLARVEADLADASPFELVDLREMLECRLVALAAQRADDKGLEAIGEACRRMRESVEERKDFINADLAFHQAIATSVGYSATGAMLRLIHELMHKFFDLAHTSQTWDYRKEAVDTAEQVVAHLAEGEERQAIRCMRKHLDLVKHGIVSP